LLRDRGTCEQFSQGRSWKRTGRDSNPRPFGSRANALPLRHTGHSLSLVCFTFFYFTGTEAFLTTTPENVVVLRGQDAILNCSTNLTSSTGENPITWNYDGDVVSYIPCTSQHPGLVASPPDSATDCNIRALASWQRGISGVYGCRAGYGRVNQAIATVIVLGKL